MLLWMAGKNPVVRKGFKKRRRNQQIMSDTTCNKVNVLGENVKREFFKMYFRGFRFFLKRANIDFIIFRKKIFQSSKQNPIKINFKETNETEYADIISRR